MSLLHDFVFVTVILIIAVLPAIHVQAAPHSTYENFAQPIATYSLSSRSLTFSSASDQKTLSVSASDDAVYRYAYASLDGSAWRQVALTGNVLGGSWLNGTVSGQLTFNAANFSLTQSRLSTGRNFVVVYTCSRSGDTWDCHDGWQIWQFSAGVSSPYPSWAKIIGVSASTYETTHVPENTLDGDFSDASRWSGDGDGAWIQYELNETAMVDGVSVAAWDRACYFIFDIAVSTDGSSWITVYSGHSDGVDNGLEMFSFSPVPARYVRITGHGNTCTTYSSWNSYLEVRIDDFPIGIGTGCVPACAGKSCGPDGCGGSCGSCSDGNSCTTDSCSGGACSHTAVTSCSGGDSCCPPGCSYPGDSDCGSSPPAAPQIDVIGPHEFWTHGNAQNGDYVGYVKFFDMNDNVNPSFSIVSGNNGAFQIAKAKETASDAFYGGLITVANRNLLGPGAVYTLSVRIYDSATGKDSTTDVVVHVATSSQAVYFDSTAASGGDGSYARPHTGPGSVGSWNYLPGKVYLFKRGCTFDYPIDVQNAGINQQNPVVFGAYGQGARPVLDGSSGEGTVGIWVGAYSSRETMSYLYFQNLEIRNWSGNAIVNGPYGHNHMWFLDVYIHDCGDEGGGSWFMWASNFNEPDNLYITVVNCEVGRSVYAGTKWYADGMRIYNFLCHDSEGTCMRFVSVDGDPNIPGDKACFGCVFRGNNVGVQMRSSYSQLKYFKVYDSWWNGVDMWFADSVYSDTIVENFIVENGIISGGFSNAGVEIWGRIRNVTVRNVNISDAYDGTGVNVLGYEQGMTRDVTIENCVIKDNTGQGILVSDKDSAGGYSRNVVIRNNVITGNDGGGILADYVNGLAITGNAFSGNGGQAISYAPSTSSGVVISGNSGA